MNKLKKLSKEARKKLNSAIKSAKDKLKKAGALALGFLKGAALASLIMGSIMISALFVVVYGPQLHEDYLRAHIGQVVIKVIRDKQAVSGGTGFIVKAPSGESFILTNRHVCKMNNQKVGDLVLVTTPDESRQVMRRIIDISDEADLCLVENLPNMKGVALADSYHVGEQIAIIGHPRLMALTVSRGQLISKKDIDIIDAANISKEECEARSKRHKFIDLSDNPLAALFGYSSFCVFTATALETNAITMPGNSGSPVSDFYGNIIGVLFAGNNDTGWGYIVPLEDVQKFLSIY